jgi:hypothetical protein
MVVKKKSVKKEESTLEDAPLVEEERRPPVTQVVEVLEDGDEETHTAIAEPPSRSEVSESSEEKEEDMSSVSDQMEEQAPAAADDEKRRVLMDELFQKKTEARPVATEVMPEISVHKKSPMRSLIMWAIMLVVMSLVVGGIILAANGKGISLPAIMATPTPTPTSTPTPTPTPDVSQLDRSVLSIQVLNGSGIAGEAGKMKDALEEKGYTVENTGNAETYDYETTEIFVKAESEEYLPLLEEDLKELYSLGTVEATLEDDVTYDVRIIVGKE